MGKITDANEPQTGRQGTLKDLSAQMSHQGSCPIYPYQPPGGAHEAFYPNQPPGGALGPICPILPHRGRELVMFVSEHETPVVLSI